MVWLTAITVLLYQAPRTTLTNQECCYKKNLKESCKRPNVAQMVPRGLGAQISWHSAHEGGEVISLTHRPPLSPGMFLVLIFTRGWVDPRAMLRSEVNTSLKNPVPPPGIDHGTVRLVAQCLDHYATPRPRNVVIPKQIHSRNCLITTKLQPTPQNALTRALLVQWHILMNMAIFWPYS